MKYLVKVTKKSPRCPLIRGNPHIKGSLKRVDREGVIFDESEITDAMRADVNLKITAVKEKEIAPIVEEPPLVEKKVEAEKSETGFALVDEPAEIGTGADVPSACGEANRKILDMLDGTK